MPKLREELAPLLRHTAAVLIVLACLFTVGLVLKLLTWLLPRHDKIWDVIATVDLVTGVLLVCMYAIYVLVSVGIILYKALRDQWSKSEVK